MTVYPEGRQAETRYKTLEVYRLPLAVDQNQDFLSFLECQPLTGRMHQIRVHLAHLGHPIVGDSVYAGRKRTRRDRAWCTRHFLHASTLTFTHPRTKEKLTFTSPLPADLQAALDQLVKL
jgi:23S rRNA pseudouridine1911/1915/1917 synthase